MAKDLKFRITAQDRTKGEFQKVNRSLKSTEQSMNRIKGALAAAFSVGVIANFAKQTLALADTIGKTADSIGVSTEFLQKYQFAAQQSGLSTEEFNKSMQNFTKMVGQSAIRTNEVGRTLEKLGISVTNVDGTVKKSEVVFMELFAALDNVGTELEKNAILADIFGRAGVKLSVMAKDGSAAMQELANSATGIIPEESIRQAEIFNDTMNELKRATLLPLQTAVIAVANSFLDLLDAMNLIERRKTVSLLQQELADLEKQLARTLNVESLMGGEGFDILDFFGFTTADSAAAKKRIIELRKEIAELTKTTDKFFVDPINFEEANEKILKRDRKSVV